MCECIENNEGSLQGVTMIERDDLYFRLLFLVPDANFWFWPTSDGDKGRSDAILLDGWYVIWSNDNISPCPTIADIVNVDPISLENFISTKAKSERNQEKAKDLTLVALFNSDKVSNPTLTFSQYLDSLEELQSNLDI